MYLLVGLPTTDVSRASPGGRMEIPVSGWEGL